MAGDPDASFVFCRTGPSLADYAPRLRATAGYHQPAATWRWTKLVAPGADAGVHHLVDVHSSDFTDDKIYVDAYQPFSEEKISMQEALEKGAQPLREFMLRQTREADLGLFARLANTGPLQGPEAVPMRILLPAYVTSELKTAFQIGFTIFIPFLIIDLVIASVLMALGMMMVPPATIALPFKLMLFVLVDGWQLLVGSLAQSFYS